MNVTDYDNMIDDYNDSLSIKSNCIINENNIGLIIPTPVKTTSFLCLLSLMVYTLFKPLFNNE